MTPLVARPAPTEGLNPSPSVSLYPSRSLPRRDAINSDRACQVCRDRASGMRPRTCRREDSFAFPRTNTDLGGAFGPARRDQTSSHHFHLVSQSFFFFFSSGAQSFSKPPTEKKKKKKKKKGKNEIPVPPSLLQ